MKFRLIMTCLLIALSLALAACSGGGTESVSLTVEMNDQFRFVPETLEVPAGSEVTLDLSNVGALEHEMVIFMQGVVTTPPVETDFIAANVYWEARLDPKTSQTFTFTAPQEAGDYQIICAIPGHFEAGMVASLKVTP